MKKYLLLVVALLIVAFMAIGFTLFTRMHAVQPGEYYCDANENGVMTSYPVYNILPDGKLEEEFTGSQGEWSNNVFNGTVTFSGDVSLEKAVFNKDAKFYLVTIRPGSEETYRSGQFIIIENSALQCYLAYPAGE
jgi:hypothetical protein